ncbi:MAG TPA: maleylpyruvate isomerase N-terminal domain-containing protein [Actinomycetales bacterium]
MLAVGRAGLSDLDPYALGEEVLGAWDAFLALVTHPSTDLTRPSRLSGWTGADTCIHLGAWPESQPLRGLLASAARDGAGEPADQDAVNTQLVAAHRAEGPARIVAALQEARDLLGEFFASDLPAEVGRQQSHSAVGQLPVLSLVHAGTYELAVHALDLAPCGAPAPDPLLLERGLAALIDVTGALSARSGVRTTVTAQTGPYGWQFTSDADGWSTRRVPGGHDDGCGVRGSVEDLLDTSAGRTVLPQLLLQRRLVVQDLPAFMRLAPLLHEVPGLPGGAALRGAVGGLSKVTRLLRLGR